jgi:hypothetical protein
MNFGVGATWRSVVTDVAVVKPNSAAIYENPTSRGVSAVAGDPALAHSHHGTRSVDIEPSTGKGGRVVIHNTLLENHCSFANDEAAAAARQTGARHVEA